MNEDIDINDVIQKYEKVVGGLYTDTFVLKSQVEKLRERNAELEGLLIELEKQEKG